MKKILAPAVLAVALAAGAAISPSYAAPIGGPLLMQRIANGEFRGYTRTLRGFENQIWRFLPDGRVHAIAEAQKMLFNSRNFRQEWQDFGSWRVEGDRVCVAFPGPNRDLNGCYAVDVRFGKHVRLVGPYVWEGTLEPRE
ncbi:MAG: hypothetical protein KIT16_11385 [Rhodospirillaceae bacterium]|nr:hypothetical protein [Rhodospirillaceae bacterium]